MSAFYSICYEDRIEILTDGAIYADNGVLLDIRTKIFLGELPLAITGRGDWRTVEAFAALILGIERQRDTVDGVLDGLEAMLDDLSRMGDWPACEFLIAAFSETLGPRNFYFSTVAIEVEKAFKVYPASDEIGGGPPVEMQELHERGVAEGDDLRGSGVALFDLMRSKKARNPARPELPEIHGIGGKLDFTTIRRDGFSVELLCTWGDRVGETINPANQAVLVG